MRAFMTVFVCGIVVGITAFLIVVCPVMGILTLFRGLTTGNWHKDEWRGLWDTYIKALHEYKNMLREYYQR